MCSDLAGPILHFLSVANPHFTSTHVDAVVVVAVLCSENNLDTQVITKLTGLML